MSYENETTHHLRPRLFKKFKPSDLSTSHPMGSSDKRKFLKSTQLDSKHLAKNIFISKSISYELLSTGDKYEDKSKFLFFKPKRYNNWIPTLHTAINLTPKGIKRVQIDKGARRHILSGANIMCPGITSLGGRLDQTIKIDDPVIIDLEDYPIPIAVGVATMSGEEIARVNQGVCINVLHCIRDGLWKTFHIELPETSEKKEDGEESNSDNSDGNSEDDE